MFIFKEIENVKTMFKNRFITQKEAANEIGITPENFSRIINRRIACSKITAYAITKFFDSEAEINDYFDVHNK